MSLDVYLTIDNPVKTESSGSFIRKDGRTVEISDLEWRMTNPDRAPTTYTDVVATNEVYWANITHNLGVMARQAGIYYALWRPDEIGISKAGALIHYLETGLDTLEACPDHFRKFNPENGWGTYEGLVQFVREYLAACKEYPEATVQVSR